MGSFLRASPASPAPLPTTGASSFPIPLHRLPPPCIHTPQHFHTSPAPIPTSLPTTPPPLFHTSTPPSPWASIPPRPSLAPPGPGRPASLPPRRQPLPCPSAPHLRRASDTCPPPVRSHTRTCRPSQSGMNFLMFELSLLRQSITSMCLHNQRQPKEKEKEKRFKQELFGMLINYFLVTSSDCVRHPVQSSLWAVGVCDFPSYWQIRVLENVRVKNRITDLLQEEASLAPFPWCFNSVLMNSKWPIKVREYAAELRIWNFVWYLWEIWFISPYLSSWLPINQRSRTRW